MSDSELLAMLLDNIDDYSEPDPDDHTRQWNDRYSTYHRGCVLFSGAIPPEAWKHLGQLVKSRFRTED